jgi:D-glycero-D-manno-heptose 1,7-bisphosphate phosphatase
MSDRPARERVVILDRDGTIVVDRGYLGDPDGLEFLPHAAEGLRWFHENGYRLVVITNQSGVGRGIFPIARVHAMNERLQRMAADIGAPLTAIYHCPHAPEARCACRKPAQGLLERAAAEWQFDPKAALVIGDKLSDVEFGKRAGAVTILITPAAQSDAGADGPEPAPPLRPDATAANLVEAARIVAAGSRGEWR